MKHKLNVQFKDVEINQSFTIHNIKYCKKSGQGFALKSDGTFVRFSRFVHVTLLK